MFDGRFLRFENKVETRLISRLVPDAFPPLLPLGEFEIKDSCEVEMFSTAGGNGTDGGIGAGVIG
jgi:hypothetical protein